MRPSVSDRNPRIAAPLPHRAQGSVSCRSSFRYDDRDGHIWLNGELVAWREAKVHVLTHGLHYASAVFEGERCYDGADLQEHRAQPAPDRQRPHPGLRGSLHRGRAGCGEGRDGGQVGLRRLLCPARSPGAARSRWASRRSSRGSTSPSPCGNGAPTTATSGSTRAHLRPACTEHRTGARQGRWPLHDLHDLQARRRVQGLRRCADAGLSGLRRRDHRAPTSSW